MPEYSLKIILATFSNKNGKKLTIFNAASVGGISSLFIKLLFIALPFIEYFAIFNPFVFAKLGIVTSIVTYIVFMSIIMMLIFFIILKVKKNIMQKITPSWEYYFKEISLKMVLSTGITPYSDFFIYYQKIINNDLSEDELYVQLKESFTKMQEENKELLIAIKKDNQNI